MINVNNMSEISMNVSPSASTSSFKSMENVVNSSTEEASHTTSILEDIPNEFLEHDNHTDPISTPSHESEELSGELRQLMNKNNQLPDIPTPLEDKYIEDSLSEIKINSDDNFWLTEDWQRKERHIFILSSSGKPVYSRYGCEDKLATLFGVMQALVSFVQDTDEDRIQSIKAGDLYFSFLPKGYLVVVSVCQHHHSDQTLLQQQLLYIYNQIISTLTLSQLTKIFDQHRNFDLRRLLSGSERLIHTLVEFTETEVDFVLASYRCLTLSSSIRDQISHVLSSAVSKVKNLVFIILIGADRIISYLHMKKYNLRPMDIHLILNLVRSSESFKTGEIWTPLCLPQFDASGYLYSHVSYLADDCAACLLMLTVDKNLFFTLSEAKQVITEKLRRAKLLDEINTALSSSHSLLTSSLNITSLRHFVYKCKQTSQLICPQYEAPYVANSNFGSASIQSR
ncbi:vacuolar fusion protein MON1 homolog A [Diaphorina citri]|uniref:Vacuolar fusion protein MON1 homolog n=1 Tax=Diaphorina citri TaxID=121845 RepID=A0A1S3DR28_DIACI|nr:vacuolar fusion protein MON1 homolog A [Diaphorina citri]